MSSVARHHIDGTPGRFYTWKAGGAQRNGASQGHKAMDDDSELEGTDLRRGRSLPHTMSDTSASRALPTEDEPLGATWKPTVRPSPGGARWLRAVVVAAAVLLVTVLLLGSVPDSRASLASLLHLPTPTPTAPLAFGADQFSAVNGVPWGVLRSDGKPVALSQSQAVFVFSLPRGRHTLEYRAGPFPVLRSVVSVPVSPPHTSPPFPPPPP